MTATEICREWIAVDWGTTTLRAWAMAGGAAIGRVEARLGMGALGAVESAGAA